MWVRLAELIGLKPKDSTANTLVQRTVRMLRLCNYDLETLNTVFAYTLALFEKVLQALPQRGELMTPVERTAIAILTCFLGHTMFYDETCPLRYWQARIYSDYCSLRDLNLAVMKIMRLLQYKLTPEQDAIEVMRHRLLRPAL
jgi:hypothetical protein